MWLVLSWGKTQRLPGKNIQGPRLEPGLHPGEAPQRKGPVLGLSAAPGRAPRRSCYSNMVSTWAKVPSHLFNTQTSHGVPDATRPKGVANTLCEGGGVCFFLSFLPSSVLFIILFPVNVFEFSQIQVWRCRVKPTVKSSYTIKKCLCLIFDIKYLNINISKNMSWASTTSFASVSCLLNIRLSLIFQPLFSWCYVAMPISK